MKFELTENDRIGINKLLLKIADDHKIDFEDSELEGDWIIETNLGDLEDTIISFFKYVEEKLKRVWKDGKA